MNALVEQFANNPTTSLTSGIDGVVTVIPVSSVAQFPSSTRFRLLIDGELMLVVKIDSIAKTFTVQRGIEGTIAAAHLASASVHGVLTKEALTRITSGPIQQEINRVKGDELFLMSCHQSSDQLTYLMASCDGKDWSLINPNPIMIPGSGNQRDPSIFKIRNKYWIAHTNSTNTYFTVLSSVDLINWTVVTNVSMTGIAGLNLVWAPEWFVDDDESVHVFVSCSTGGSTTNFQLYEVHPTNLTMTTWSAPALITGTALPANIIDPFVVKKAGFYYIWYKENTAQYIEYMKSASLTVGYTVQQSGNWAAFGTPREAPCLVQVDSTTWRIYINNISGLNSISVLYSESTNDWASWSAPVAVTSPWVIAHPTVVRAVDIPTLRNVIGSLINNLKTEGAVVNLSANQSIPNNVATPITFASMSIDQFGAWNPATPTRLTFPSTGWYTGVLHVKWADAAGGKRVLDTRINGTIYVGGISAEATTNHPGPDSLGTFIYFATRGDYVELAVFQNQGGAVNVTSAVMTITKLP